MFLGLILMERRQASAQCPSITIEGNGFSIARPKVGTQCTNNTPPCYSWYLKSTTGITTINSTQLDTYGSSDWLVWNDNGTIVTTDPDTLSNGQPDAYTVSIESYSTKDTTTYGSGSGSFTSDCCSPATYTKDVNDGTWSSVVNGTTSSGLNYDSSIYPRLSESGLFPDPVYGYGYYAGLNDPVLITNDPDSCVRTKIIGSYYYENFNYLVYHVDQTLTTESKLEVVHETTSLKSKVDGLAAQGMNASTSWGPGATTLRTLAWDESRADATDSKYRFKIEGTDPKKRYTIHWIEEHYNENGTTTNSFNIKHEEGGIRGKAGIWYYPSSDGKVMLLPDWPGGCPNGGMHRVTYKLDRPPITEDP
jgi:hypothetical protein